MLRIYGVKKADNSNIEDINFYTNKETAMSRLRELNTDSFEAYQIIYIDLDDTTKTVLTRHDGSVYEYKDSIALERQRLFDTAMEVLYEAEGFSKEEIAEKLLNIVKNLDNICKTIGTERKKKKTA